eukprot:CAMPEP_0170459826 /NCGR_PEP_ID=MMETSP0123-20130129/6383_1 /TAXON_ID=182087 /ORGANISM="Favella ehrenbergii, Strain Fehren 1" /LENGTH=43 /DNA_ID= /DNA_START= /DNA_END= /DNA_ORIENTATION=
MPKRDAFGFIRSLKLGKRPVVSHFDETPKSERSVPAQEHSAHE